MEKDHLKKAKLIRRRIPMAVALVIARKAVLARWAKHRKDQQKPE
jgi:hypothetical protein